MKQHTFAKFLLAIAIGHSMTGVLLFWQYLIQIPHKGWVNAIGPNFMEGSVAVWFLLFSWPLILIVLTFWNQNEKVKKSFLYTSIVGSIFAITLMPFSGFWLLLILASVAIVQNNRIPI